MIKKREYDEQYGQETKGHEIVRNKNCKTPVEMLARK